MAGQTEIVVETIVIQIDNGEIAPGQPIDEKALGKLLGVSRTPVREALIRLEADGLIQRHPRKGAVLFKPNVDEFLAILEVHANLECHAATLAARRATPEINAKLGKIVEACQQHVQQHAATRSNAYYQLNLRFHEAVALASGNPVLLQMIKTNARKLMAYYRMRYRHPGTMESSAQEHELIAGLILDQRSSEASEAMAQHFNYDRSTIMDLITLI